MSSLETIIELNDRKRVFLLSPANAGGERGKLLLNPRAGFELAHRLQSGSAPIGEVYAFISGLYFRGKLAYVDRFANPPPETARALVIAAGRGLVPPETLITMADFLEIARVPIDLAEPRYRAPFERDAAALASSISPDAAAILLGSVATPKYLRPLLEVFGDRLLFPADFPGRGDMSRGGLMLRCARSGEELRYVSATTAARHGLRPPKLPKAAPPEHGVKTP